MGYLRLFRKMIAGVAAAAVIVMIAAPINQAGVTVGGASIVMAIELVAVLPAVSLTVSLAV